MSDVGLIHDDLIHSYLQNLEEKTRIENSLKDIRRKVNQAEEAILAAMKGQNIKEFQRLGVTFMAQSVISRKPNPKKSWEFLVGKYGDEMAKVIFWEIISITQNALQKYLTATELNAVLDEHKSEFARLKAVPNKFPVDNSSSPAKPAAIQPF